jgi:hypothetical protein
MTGSDPDVTGGTGATEGACIVVFGISGKQGFGLPAPKSISSGWSQRFLLRLQSSILTLRSYQLMRLGTAACVLHGAVAGGWGCGVCWAIREVGIHMAAASVSVVLVFIMDALSNENAGLHRSSGVKRGGAARVKIMVRTYRGDKSERKR